MTELSRGLQILSSDKQIQMFIDLFHPECNLNAEFQIHSGSG